MSKISTVGHDIKVAAVDTEHAIVKTVTFLPKASAVLAEAIKDQPEIKSEILKLVQLGTAVVGDGATDVAEKGVNLVDDAKTLAAAEAFFVEFKANFVPLVEKVYGEIKADVTA